MSATVRQARRISDDWIWCCCLFLADLQVTAGLYENSFFMGLINILVYVAVAPMLERSWGGYSFLQFICVVNLCVAVTVWLCMVACYAATEFEPCLYVHTNEHTDNALAPHRVGGTFAAFPFFFLSRMPNDAVPR